jgi:glutathione S-transferase
MIDTSCDFMLSELRNQAFYSQNNPQDTVAKAAFMRDELGGHLVSLIAMLDQKSFFVGDGKGHLTAADISVYALLVRLRKELPDLLDYFPILHSWARTMHKLDFIDGAGGNNAAEDELVSSSCGA